MNVPLTRAAEGLARRAFTIAELERMVEAGVIAPDERLELIGGEIVPMSPKGARHETTKVALALRWGRLCPAGFAFAPETGLRLDEHTYLEPDFIVFKRSTRLADVKGPDVLLAIEVADSSLSYDLNRKPLVYAGFGVPELWVIDAGRAFVHRHIDPSPSGYGRVETSGRADRSIPTYAPPEFAFALDELEPI
ncbi:MAG TPA: Uma2 family endonuclease [Roseiarcus sp.]|nr:Uma2 family endonuclease [Roseiarcus sp.]